MSTPDRNSTNWAAQTKFAIALETASMSEAELAKYCRGKAWGQLKMLDTFFPVDYRVIANILDTSPTGTALAIASA